MSLGAMIDCEGSWRRGFTETWQPAGDDRTAGSTLAGTPVSPGVVVGLVRVVLDPSGAQLTPGEIRVCRGTDPAWTPLFLAAA